MQIVEAWQEALQRLRELKPEVAKAARDGTGYYETVRATTSKLKASMPKQAAKSLAYSLREVVVGTCRSVYTQELGPDFLTSGFGPSGSPTVKEEVLQPIPRSVRLAYGFPSWGLDGEAAQLAGTESDGAKIEAFLKDLEPEIVELLKNTGKDETIKRVVEKVKARYVASAHREVKSEELESLTPSIRGMTKIKVNKVEKEDAV